LAVAVTVIGFSGVGHRFVSNRVVGRDTKKQTKSEAWSRQSAITN